MMPYTIFQESYLIPKEMHPPIKIDFKLFLNPLYFLFFNHEQHAQLLLIFYFYLPFIICSLNYVASKSFTKPYAS